VVGHIADSSACVLGLAKGQAHRPARSILRIACGIEKPSNTGTACVTPSPESRTIPVVRPEEYLAHQLRCDNGLQPYN
jgi:hypothetical protein